MKNRIVIGIALVAGMAMLGMANRILGDYLSDPNVLKICIGNTTSATILMAWQENGTWTVCTVLFHDGVDNHTDTVPTSNAAGQIMVPSL